MSLNVFAPFSIAKLRNGFGSLFFVAFTAIEAGQTIRFKNQMLVKDLLPFQ